MESSFCSIKASIKLYQYEYAAWLTDTLDMIAKGCVYMQLRWLDYDNFLVRNSIVTVYYYSIEQISLRSKEMILIDEIHKCNTVHRSVTLILL